MRGALLIFLLERIYHEERLTMTKLNLIMQGREHDWGTRKKCPSNVAYAGG